MKSRLILPHREGLPASLFLLLLLSLLIFYPHSGFAQCGTCDYTEANLAGGTPIDVIPPGKTLCITSNYCLGTSANWPASCGNVNSGHLTINGTLRICSGMTFKFDGTIDGSGNIQIMAGGRMSLYGTYDCNVHMTAIDPDLLAGGSSTSTTVGGCNSAACEPHFSDGYAPFGIVGSGLGYTVNNGSCAISGVADLIVLPVDLLSWNAVWKGNNILLSWSAPARDQGAIYTVEYSADGSSWSALSKIPGTDADGINWYTYLAQGSFGKRNFLRIRHTTPDGETALSPVKELDADAKGGDGFFVGPTPVANVLLIRPDDVNTRFTGQLFDMTGKPVLKINSGAGGQYPVGSLLPGAYFLVLTKEDGTRLVKKITKL